MGVERVLQAAGWLTALATATAVAAPREPVAVIDLGPPDPAVRQRLAAAIVGGGLDALIGDGLDDALAGESASPDAVQLAAALAEAQRAFGALDCARTLTAARTAIGIAAARQAAGLAVPELPRAWTYALLCADRTGDVDAAMLAAARLRALQERAAAPAPPADVPAAVWAKYPAVDAMLDRELFAIEITTDLPGAAIWIDFQRAGTAPLTVTLPAGEHVIAAAAGTRRGWAAGTVVRSQPTVTVPTADQAGPHAALAARIAGWHGQLPAPDELAHVLDTVKARVAIVRRGDRIEAWGRIGRSEAPRRLGGEDGAGTLDEAGRVVALIADRVQTWNDRAPDPDLPLLVEDPAARGKRPERADTPTKWWVYASIFGALAVGGGLIYVNEVRTNTQRVELHWP